MQRLILGILFGGACFYWFAREVTWTEMLNIVASINMFWVSAAVILLLLEFVIRSIRWKIILRSLDPNVAVFDLFRAQVIGGAANTLLPLRLGEIIKPTIVCNRTHLAFISVATTSVVERVYDLLGMVSVLVFMVLFLQPTLTPTPNQVELINGLQFWGGLLGFGAVVAMGIFFALASQKEAMRPVFLKITSIAPTPIQNFFMRLFDGFIKGLGNSTDTSGVWISSIISVGMWLNGAMAIFCLFKAFSLSLPFGAACFISVGIALSVALPQAPGFIGVFHIAIFEALSLWEQDPTVSKSFALIFWGVSFIPVTLIGLSFAMFEDINWRNLIQNRQHTE